MIDPFCGSGTAAVAAQLTERRWVACDVASIAIDTSIRRLDGESQAQVGREYAFGDQDLLVEEFPVHSNRYRSLAIRPSESSDLIEPKFFKGLPVPIEETRHYEFKEVTGKRPLDSIKNTADEYVVAFLNSEGGRIYWGIRDSDRSVVGVSLTHPERDELRRVVTEKLAAIKPAVDPTAYRLEIHPVYEGISRIPDLHVVEIVVPRVRISEVYFTGGNDVFVKTEAGKMKLTGPTLVEWLRPRLRDDGPSRVP